MVEVRANYVGTIKEGKIELMQSLNELVKIAKRKAGRYTRRSRIEGTNKRDGIPSDISYLEKPRPATVDRVRSNCSMQHDILSTCRKLRNNAFFILLQKRLEACERNTPCLHLFNINPLI